MSPNHAEAKKIMVRLQDPEWYNHALTPEHVQNVGEVDRLLKVAQGYFSLGDFDNAEKQYDAVKLIDTTQRLVVVKRRSRKLVAITSRVRDHISW